MSSGLPYRPPAGGWRSKMGRGRCFQHWRRGLAHTQVYQNTTRVPNWLCAGEPGGGGNIPPYTRWSSGDDNEGNVNPNCDIDAWSPGGGAPTIQILPGHPHYCDSVYKPHKPPCGEWTRRDFAAAIDAGESRQNDVYAGI